MPDGQQTAHLEEDARRMWAAGQLRPDTLYWKEGMAEWSPLTELFGAANPQMRPTARVYKAPLPTTLALQILLYISLATAFILFILAAKANHDKSLDGFTAAMLVMLLDSLVALPVLILFFCWIHQADRNCRQFGATDMRFTPGWSVGCFFVPLLNLYRPYQAMKQIWQVSTNPTNWKSERRPDMLVYWWIFHLLVLFMSSQICTAVVTKDGRSLLDRLFYFCLFTIALRYFMLKLVTEIQRRQKQLVLAGF